MSHRKRPHGSKLRSLFLWHRYMGLVAAGFVVIIAITGIMLNHTTELELDQRLLASDLLLDAYGIPQQQPITAYRAADHWVIGINNTVYFNHTALPDTTGRLLGATDMQDMVAIAISDALLLVTNEGQLVERIRPADGLPCTPHALAKHTHTLILQCSDQSAYYSDDLLTWSPHKGQAHWSQPAQPPQALATEIQRDARSQLLNLERAILDLHSGRLFGPIGVIIYDLAAVLMLLLAGSGVLHWAKRKRK